MNEWRKIPIAERPYNAYRQARYVESGCDHAGPYCKCDPPYWLRAPTAAEQAIEVRRRELLAAAQADAERA